ncbi:uncharacterized protein LOC133302023 [Gastrolobium bilobum]|uniref:uncharacterized protein LOC133302023 n=1 Tax=Gastrolobium bilobum TaxID=150636 RepID=UPI002AB210D8|nr:uncharacterized protein LOC133302023 [Gastrolobium bilobum]
MPNYVKFMKDLLSRKCKLKECEIVALTEECSAIIQKKLPPKLKDPGSISIPIAIGNIEVGKALCDLGASINPMPLSMCRALGIKELKPTTVSLQLADRSIRRPDRVIEDVLVKIDKFIFPADFVVLNMEEDTEILLLLGRPFLATAKAMIDVEQGKLMLRVNEETITIDVFESMKHPTDGGDCFMIDIIQEATDDAMKKTIRNPNKAFFGCPNFKEKKPHCNFFTWVDDATSDTMELEDWRINKLELNVAKTEFKLNFVDMKLNDELQLEVNDHKKKINEHHIKIDELSVKMQEEFERVEKEIKHVCRCARVFAGSIIVVFVICIYLASRVE